MCSLAGSNRRVDLVTLCGELDRAGNLAKAGGREYIAALGNVPLASAGVCEYARMVKDCSIVRGLLNASRNIAARCMENRESVAELLETAHTQLFDVSERTLGGTGGPQSMAEIVAGLIPELERTAGQGMVIGQPTGFSTLDALTAGWPEGELVVLAARPSMGKSALALDFVRKLAQRNVPVGMFSLEMNKKSLALRLACRISQLDSNRLRLGRLNKTEFDFLVKAMGELQGWPIWIDDTPGLSIEQIQWRARALAQRVNPRLVVVDHIQLVHAKAENRTQEVTRVSGGIQQTAREVGRICKGTFLALSQLSRIGPHEEPQLHHLRESGSIEQDADTVLFLWDKAGEEPDAQTGAKQIMLKVGKQRNGPTGLDPLVWIPARVGFEETDWTPTDSACERRERGAR